jgi:hypothetical protein
MKGMEIKRVIQYSDLYPEQADNLPDAQEFIKGLRREDLCTLTANMVSRLSGMPFYDFNFNPRKNEFDFVRFFLSDCDPVFTQDVINRHSAAVKRLPENYKGIFIATGKAAIMTFQRLFFSVEPETKPDWSPQIEKDYSRALLRVNEDVYESDYDGEKHMLEPLDLRLAHLYLAYNYANEDVESLDLHDAFRRQLTKSITLFTFLFRSKDKRIKALRRRFLAHFHIGNWVEYIIPHIMTIHYLHEKSGLLMIKGDSKYGRKGRRVIERSSIEKDAIILEKDNPDFMMFRGKPYIRMRKHHYAITNLTFVVEHIYNSVYFELRSLRKDAGFLNDDEFRQYYTTEFSQKFMFEGYVKHCLPLNTMKAVSGSECDAMLEKAKRGGANTDGIVPPDYYVKVPEGCIVFEYKDSLTSAKVKESRNEEKLFKDIKKKFFENDKGKHKGITQLLDNVEAIQKGSFFFDNVDADAVIYPVLVADNPVYSMRGMHTVLEYMMRDECAKRGLRSENIKPLILTDVATLKLYADYFNKNGMVVTFEQYYQHINPNDANVENEPFEMLISFTEFMKDKDIGSMHIVFDRLLHEAAPVIRHYN